jgi:hypothetical protein
MASPTVLRLGAYDFLGDALVAHPASPTGAIINLNDSQTFTLLDDGSGFGEGLRISPPTPKIALTGNSRTVGQRLVRRVYADARVIVARLDWNGRGGTYAAWQTALHNILQTLEGITADAPGCLQIQTTGSAQTYYADVVEAHCPDISYRELLWAQQLDSVTLEFIIYPLFRQTRKPLSNLVNNPGFEAPAGGGIAPGTPTAFNDTFATLNAYTSIAGGAPSLAANVMTIPAGATVGFGSPAWGAVSTWKIRFKYASTATANFYAHYTDANNKLDAQVFTNGIVLVQFVGGVSHSLSSSGAPTLTNGNFYWLLVTQFPTASGTTAYVTATLYNDSAGAQGTAVANGAVAGYTFDTVTALSGKMAIETATAALLIGGAFSSVHVVSLFGPGGWATSNVTATPSYAWDGARGELGMSGTGSANTYPSGPVTSSGAARVDCPPTGAFEGFWLSGPGAGTPTGTTMTPVVAATNTLGWSVAAKQTGLGGSGVVEVYFDEYDNAGSFLRSGAPVSLLSNNAWTKFSGTYVTGTSCAYVRLDLHFKDTTSGSANGVLYFDNTQVWNQTTTGQNTMPYCELRFPNTPAQLVVSGVVGDAVAPAYLALATYLTSFAAGGVLSFAAGRRARVHKDANLTGSLFILGIAYTPTLDNSAYGGYTVQNNANAGQQEADTTTYYQQEQALLGAFHEYVRAQSSQATIANVTVSSGAYDGSWVAEKPAFAPFAAGSTWTFFDAGAVEFPMTPVGALAGAPTSGPNVFPRLLFKDSTGGGSKITANHWALMPVDGSILTGTVVNPTVSATGTLTSQWLWIYSDPLLLTAGQNTPVAWRRSNTAQALTTNVNAGGGPATLANSYLGVNPTADSYLTLDPNLNTANATGVNQIVAAIADNTAAVMALGAEILYAPQFLYPE